MTAMQVKSNDCTPLPELSLTVKGPSSTPAERMRLSTRAGTGTRGMRAGLGYIPRMGKLERRAAVLLSILLASSVCAFGLDPSLDVSQYAHTAWKTREGFTRGTIFAMAQTPDGYLWLGTEFGLLRFDGVQAIQWQPPDGEQLPSNWIQALLVARDGALWIGTDKGLASYKDGKLTKYPEVAGHLAGPLLQDGNGTVWVAVQDPGRLWAIQPGTSKFYGDGSFGDAVLAVYSDRRGNLWVSAQTGLWRWAPGPPEHYRLPDGRVAARALIEDDNGALLMTTGLSSPAPSLVTSSIEEGLKQLVGGKIRSYPLPAGAGQFRPTRLFRSRDGSLWVGTVQGLVHLHQGKVDRFDGLSGDVVTGIFEDREGNVWVSTLDGLDRFREFAVPTIGVNQGLSNSAVYVLQATPDGAIWIATADGLNRWQNGHVSVYRKQNVSGQNERPGERELVINARATEIANSGLRNTVYSLGHDDQGRLWAGSREGVFYFDRGRFAQVPGVPGGNIFSIAGHGHGNVWISNNDEGLFDSRPEGAVQHISWARFGHKHGAVALLPDRMQDGLWLGFFDGGIAYFKDGQIRYSYKVADGLGNGSVSDLQLGSDGAVWAATEGGLSRVKDGHVTTLTTKNGLPCDAVHWVIEDNDHSFWLNLPCGLVRIARSELDAWVSDSKRSVQTMVFDSSDGVRVHASAGRYTPKVTKSIDGKIWFSPLDGVSIINPRHLPTNKLPPPVHIEQIIADHKSYWQNWSGDASASRPKLPPLVRDLEIDYTALSLVVPGKVRFRVKLEGWDPDWKDAGNVRKAFYNNLPPRSYRFRVTACNNSGVWNEQGDALEFSIAPAYYQTTRFRLSCVAAFLTLLLALYQLRLRQVAHQFNMRLEDRVSERTRIARDLHDTLLQSFHGLLLRFQTVSNLLPPGDHKQRLDDAIDQAAQAITEGRDAVQGLRSSTLETNDLAVAIRAIGEELAADPTNHNRAAFRVQVEGTPRDLQPILRDEVYRIAAEALRNAFNHAQAHQIEVEIRYDERQLRVRVRDDGKGIDARVLNQDEPPGHFGLQGMRERAALLGGKLTVWSELDSGTEVELSVPASIAYARSPARRFPWFSGKSSAKDTELKS